MKHVKYTMLVGCLIPQYGSIDRYLEWRGWSQLKGGVKTPLRLIECIVVLDEIKTC